MRPRSLRAQMRLGRRLLRQAARLVAEVAHTAAPVLAPAAVTPRAGVPSVPPVQTPAPAPSSLREPPAAPERIVVANPRPLPQAEPVWVRVAEFGRNPGQLRMLMRAPRGLDRGAPAVVLLHGCGQDAMAFAEQSGWVTLSDRRGFALVVPEQSAANNHGRCFNWFQPHQTRRGQGEAASVVAMVDHAIAALGCDPQRVFVAGLSAGGAMAACLLAAYPDRFAGGAVVAGLPVGCADGGGQAMLRMMQAGPTRTPVEWAAAARATSPDRVARWPRLSIWQGGSDYTVNPANAEALATQFAGLHGLAADLHEDHSPDTGLRRRVWRDAAGAIAIEHWSLARMAHGYPVREGREQNWVIPVGIEASEEIARFWGI